MAPRRNSTGSKKTASAEQRYNDFVSDLFIKSIESGTAPWTKPWSISDMVSAAPRNPETGTFYKGSNELMLLMTSCMEHYDDPRWMTFNQAKNAGGQVRAGEHGVPLRTFIFEREVEVVDDNGRPVLDKDGNKVIETIEINPPIITTFTVFNVKQIEFPAGHIYSQPFDKKVTKDLEWANLQKAEDLIKNTNAQIVHGGDQAFYAPGQDYINLPPKESFKTQEGYYSTALHELSHWTGHRARLNRPFTGRFGTQGYAKEELVAEISSFMLCMNLGIGHNLENHASYVNNWAQVLKDEKSEIIEATKKAGEAQKFITSFSQNNVLDEERIYLTNKYFDEKFDEKLVELGAFFDIYEEKFYITKATHDLSKFADYLPQEELKNVFDEGKEQGLYANIDYGTFKKINDLLPDELSENDLGYDEFCIQWSNWKSDDSENWSRSVVIDAVAKNDDLLNYVLEEKELPPLAFLHWSESRNITKDFESINKGKVVPLSDANKILDKANTEFSEREDYVKTKVSVIYAKSGFDDEGNKILSTDHSYPEIRYDVGDERGDVFTHIDDFCKWCVDHQEPNWDVKEEYKDKILPLIKTKCEKFDNFKKTRAEAKKQADEKGISDNPEKEKNNVESCIVAISKAINFLNDQVARGSLSDEEKLTYIGQLGDLIIHAETLKQVLTLDADVDVKGIKSDAISSLDKRDDINEYGQFKKSQEKEQQPNITLTDVYIEVPFYEKEEAKELGAKWDRSVKHWYVPQGVDLNLFEKWKKADIAANRINAEAEKIKRNSLSRMATNQEKETVNKTKTRTKTR